MVKFKFVDQVSNFKMISIKLVLMYICSMKIIIKNYFNSSYTFDLIHESYFEKCSQVPDIQSTLIALTTLCLNKLKVSYKIIYSIDKFGAAW